MQRIKNEHHGCYPPVGNSFPLEDSDLCERLRRAGYRLALVPGNIVHKEENKTTILQWETVSHWRIGAGRREPDRPDRSAAIGAADVPLSGSAILQWETVSHWRIELAIQEEE